ncbi:hypothetical protein [Hymenobacter rubidus]|uniref:hypothetical protein n=1 Tax=Hymenobacter rubidus TaxID=1441626 RepID=UPI00191F3B14|nr:hypothetical protein [Hymenobacter rubidus]
MQTLDGLEQAEEANGNDPGLNLADDWIPEYPPQDAPADSVAYRHWQLPAGATTLPAP